MSETRPLCDVHHLTLGRAMHAVRLQNDLLSVTVLADKGADIYELTYRPRGVDVLWKSPWGPSPAAVTLPTTHSMISWLDAYPGGWQVLFPNGGAQCSASGMELGFHGEAALAAWDSEILRADDLGCQVRFWTRLRRSPFRITRLMSLKARSAALTIEERITNEGGEPLPYMWSHHPAFGAPFLGPACRIDVGARSLWADDELVSTDNPLQPGVHYPWPTTIAGQELSCVPDAVTPRALLAYFENFEAGWYAITNRELGFGIALAWPREVFPYAWFWQEMHASSGYPWYKSCYVMAIEPATSIPGQGLARVAAKTGTQRQLGPGESASVTLTAVFYEGTTGVERAAADGTVVLRGPS